MTVMSDCPVMDKTFARIVSFVSEQYPESHPLSSPPLAPLSGFALFFLALLPIIMNQKDLN